MEFPLEDRREETGGQRIVAGLLKGNLRLENVRASGERQARAEHWGSTEDSAEVPERGGPEEVTVEGEGNGIMTGSEANGLDLGTDYQGGAC